MITLNDFSFLIVTAANDRNRLISAYDSIRIQYPTNEIIIVYDNQDCIGINSNDVNLIEIGTIERVYVSKGYNLALQYCTKKCFVFLHDDTFIGPNFLENIIPHISEKQFCNFTTVEPPLYNEPSTLKKPIHNFGRSVDTFNISEFHNFCNNHISQLNNSTDNSPYGGFFIAGYKTSIDSVNGFDESFQPYFFEDSDLMLRLHLAGYTFIHILDSIVYHMGSLTSRTSSDSATAQEITGNIFIKKWKVPYEYIKQYTIDNNIPYKNIPYTINAINYNTDIKHILDLFSTENSSIIIYVDCNLITEQDFIYIQTLPYLLQSIQETGEYKIGCLNIQVNNL